MNKKKLLVVLTLCAFLSPSLSYAGTPSPWTEEANSREQVKAKLSYGLKNLLGGWTAAFKVPSNAKKDGKNVVEGIGLGLFDAVAYTLGGVVHTATFFLPGVDVPIKDGGIDFES